VILKTGKENLSQSFADSFCVTHPTHHLSQIAPTAGSITRKRLWDLTLDHFYVLLILLVSLS